MAVSRTAWGRLFATLAILGRVGYFIVTPLWLDFFNTDGNQTANGSGPPSPPIPEPTHSPPSNESDQLHGTNIFFVVAVQWGVGTAFFGLLLLATLCLAPHLITDVDRSYPKREFLVVGFSQGVSSVLVNYAMSGARTALYLQAVLSNFNIPIQFTVRFLLLKKWPSLVKLCCAVAVVVAEAVCLLPSIVPGLETPQAHHQDGGATGAGAVLWPLCFVSSMVPFAVANSVMERSVQRGATKAGSPASAPASGPVSGPVSGPASLNLVYFLFWWNLFVFLTVLLFFWVDILPGFGTSSGMAAFGDSLAFNARCMVGLGCPEAATALGWTNFAICVMASVAFAGVMRYSEGANFVIIVLTLRTPILFLFWTLFKEPPFHWQPEAHLSTWLSVGAICVMLPAIVIYDKAAPEKTSHPVVTGARRRLLEDVDDVSDEERSARPSIQADT